LIIIFLNAFFNIIILGTLRIEKTLSRWTWHCIGR